MTGYAKCVICDKIIPNGEMFWLQKEKREVNLGRGIIRVCEEHKQELIDPDKLRGDDVEKQYESTLKDPSNNEKRESRLNANKVRFIALKRNL